MKTNKRIFYSFMTSLLAVCFIFLGCSCSDSSDNSDSNNNNSTDIRYMCSSDEIDKAEKAIDYCEQYINGDLTYNEAFKKVYYLETMSSLLDDDFPGDEKLNDLICHMADTLQSAKVYDDITSDLQDDIDEMKGLIGKD